MHKCTRRAIGPERSSTTTFLEPEKIFCQHTRVPVMNSFAARFSSPGSSSVTLASNDDNDAVESSIWGSTAGFGNLGGVGVPAFDIPAIPNVRISNFHHARRSLSNGDVAPLQIAYPVPTTTYR